MKKEDIIHELLADKGGTEATAVSGSSAAHLLRQHRLFVTNLLCPASALFIFANNIIHGGRVVYKPYARRVDPADPSQPLYCRFHCNKKGSMTGDLGVEYVRGIIQPCLPDLSPDNPAVLITDGHGSHYTLELLTYCKSIGLHIVLRWDTPGLVGHVALFY